MRKLILAIVGLSAITGLAFAHSGATGIVKERMDAMKAIGAATKVIATLDWSDVDAARTKLRSAAAQIEGHAAEVVSLFPEGSTQHPSEAIDEIWVNLERFSEIARELETAAASIGEQAATATSKDDIMANFQVIGGTCKSCHAQFRRKK